MYEKTNKTILIYIFFIASKILIVIISAKALLVYCECIYMDIFSKDCVTCTCTFLTYVRRVPAYLTFLDAGLAYFYNCFNFELLPIILHNVLPLVLTNFMIIAMSMKSLRCIRLSVSSAWVNNST